MPRMDISDIKLGDNFRFPLEVNGLVNLDWVHAEGWQWKNLDGSHSWNYGMCMEAKVGTPIYACADQAESCLHGLSYDPKVGYYVFIDHGGFTTWYGRISKVNESVFDISGAGMKKLAKKGDIIAFTGDMGEYSADPALLHKPQLAFGFATYMSSTDIDPRYPYWNQKAYDLMPIFKGKFPTIWRCDKDGNRIYTEQNDSPKPNPAPNPPPKDATT